MSVVPTWYPNKTTPVDNDSLWGYDSVWIANVNFLFSSIKNYLTNSITTTDIDEWDNLYYTETRVQWSPSLALKADKTKVLELDNTTPYVPTLSTHPATKGYVDGLVVPTKASQSEAVAGVNDTKFITPLTWLTAYWDVVPWTDFTYLESNTEATSNAGDFELVKEFQINKAGWYTVSYDLSSGTGVAVTARIRVNDIDVWILRSSSATYITFVENISLKTEDRLQIFVDSGSVTITARVRNFNAKYSLSAGIPAWIVTLN